MRPTESGSNFQPAIINNRSAGIATSLLSYGQNHIFCYQLVKTITYSEEELVSGLKQSDRQAFEYLYDSYSKALFGIIYQVVSQQESAEDILQQVFVKIWKNREMYDASKGRLFTWMVNIARNQAIDHTRSKEFHKEGKTISLNEGVTPPGSSQASIRDFGLNKELEKLPTESRKLLELSYYLGYTQEEISKMLNIPLGTIKTRLRNIIIQLRNSMDLNKT